MKWLWQQSARWTLLSALLRERAVISFLLGFSFVYLFFSFFEIPLWRCVWEAVTERRCPGCGLTSGCKAFLKGEFGEGMASNWFTPAVLLGLLAIPVILALPKPHREAVLEKLERIEGRFRLVLVFLILIIVQSVARLKGWA